MASEAQRIMNVSLTKIVSSRSRRGGVSLHRNLLVASVLFKARDVYAAEMAGLVVIRNGCVYERAAVDDYVVPVAETQDLSNETHSSDETIATDDNFSTDENLIRDDQITKTVDAVVVCPFVQDSAQEQSEKVDLSGVKSSENDSDCELESCKENIEPTDSAQNPADSVSSTLKRKRRQKLQNKQCVKRKYTEVEQAVLSITENDDSGVTRKMSRMESGNCDEKISLNCSELPTHFPERSSDRVYVNREDLQLTTATPQDYKPCMDISENVYSSCTCDGDQPTYSDISSYQSSFHGFSSDYRTSPSTDAIKFQLSHPMLVVSV